MWMYVWMYLCRGRDACLDVCVDVCVKYGSGGRGIDKVCALFFFAR